MFLVPRCLKSEPPDDFALTPEEIAVIRSSWSSACKDGSNVTKNVVELVETSKNFSLHYGISQSGVGDDPGALTQAARIHAFIDTAVQALNPKNKSVVLSMARNVGVIHYYRGVSLEACNWLQFKNAFINEMDKYNNQAMERRRYFMNSLSPWTVRHRTGSHDGRYQSDGSGSKKPLRIKNSNSNCEMTDTKIAWYKFMTLIIAEMKRGLQEETLRQCQKPANKTSKGGQYQRQRSGSRQLFQVVANSVVERLRKHTSGSDSSSGRSCSTSTINSNGHCVANFSAIPEKTASKGRCNGLQFYKPTIGTNDVSSKENRTTVVSKPRSLFGRRTSLTPSVPKKHPNLIVDTVKSSSQLELALDKSPQIYRRRMGLRPAVTQVA